MFWLNYNNIAFHQIFTKYTYVDNIYCFMMDDTTNIEKKEYNKYQCKKISYTIYIKDDMIMYENKDEKKIYSIKNNVFEIINELPTFKFEYDKIHISSMPIIKKEQYDYFYEMNFKIYELDDGMFFVIEHNNNINLKSYFIVNEIYVKKFYSIKNEFY